jgi:hypothetical protein
MEIPNHLLGSHRILNSLARKMRQQHHGCKTNVKLDDIDLAVVLDYRMPDTDVWKKIRPSQAREAMPVEEVRGKETTVEEIARILSTTTKKQLTGANALPLGSDQGRS